VAAAVAAARDRATPGFRAYNVTGDRPPVFTARDFVAAFARALGRPVRHLRVPAGLIWAMMSVLRGPRMGRDSVSFLTGENPWAFDRIRRELGWEPPFDTATAVARTAKAFAR
jgi:nucleoside-diphosphate-sugar epimerase